MSMLHKRGLFGVVGLTTIGNVCTFHFKKLVVMKVCIGHAQWLSQLTVGPTF
jgi:hypothetical protein